MTRNLTVLSDLGVLLDLDEGADLGVIPNFASVEIDKPAQPNVLAELDVSRNG
jgi:hypothetical protein